MSIELKELMNDCENVERMNAAFSDLRADYELGMSTSSSKIKELEATNVDIDNHLNNLISYSKTSSGIISGLRGTGKTHLFLLAREKINSQFIGAPQNNGFCVYLNIKRVSFPPAPNSVEIVNRVFSIFLIDELTLQLKALLSSFHDKTFTQRFLELFSGDSRKLYRNFESAIQKLLEFREVVKCGTDELTNITAGSISEENFESELLDLATDVHTQLKVTGPTLETNLHCGLSEEIAKRVKEQKDKYSYANPASLRTELVKVMNLLQIRSITFYIDEWEKLYFQPTVQEILSAYINQIIDNPLYFWIGVVPNRGSLYSLAIGADLQHTINLDESLIYENSDIDRRKCIDYFTQFINNRLNYVFQGTNLENRVDISTLFNQKRQSIFELLVVASMGNSRDFGTMLARCWSEFRSYRTVGKYAGRPFKYISESMAISAIRYSGNQKRSNILDNSGSKLVWDNLEIFCTQKGSSHFVIEESQECKECLYRREFSDLIYHRLLHFRKGHLTQKDSEKQEKVSLYALDYATIYNLHADKKQVKFITNADDVHNSIRRYVYNPCTIIKELEIRNGIAVPCKSCGVSINTEKMKAAWEKNYCPYCGGHIY